MPGSANQGVKRFFGKYTYIVTPRYFDDSQSLMPLDSTLCVSVTVDVKPFEKKGLSLGFTRGFVQSQAYVRHYGPKVVISPRTRTFYLILPSRLASIRPDLGERAVPRVYEERFRSSAAILPE